MMGCHGLVLFLTLALAGSSHAAVSFVQAARAHTADSSTSVSVTLSTGTTAGNGLVAIAAGHNQSSITNMSMSGGCAVSWQQDGTDQIYNNLRVKTFSCPQTTAGVTAITANAVAGLGYMALNVMEVTGHDTTSGWYEVGTVQNQAVGSPTSGSINTTQPDSILIGGYIEHNTDVRTTDMTSITSTSGMTIPANGVPLAKAGAARLSMAMAYRIVTSTGSYEAAWTSIGGLEGIALIRAYTAAAGVDPILFFRRRIP